MSSLEQPADAHRGLEVLKWLRLDGVNLRRSLFVLACTLLGMALGAVYAAVSPPVYEASATVLVASVTGDDGSALTETNDAQQKVLTLADLATSSVVIERVIATADLDQSPEGLRSRLTAEAVPQTVLLEIVAQDSDPEQAREIANTVALELDGYVQEINEQNPGSAADTAARLVDPALTPQNRTSPQPAIALALGLVGGFTAGLILMAAIARRDDLLRTESRVEQVTGAPSLGSFLGLAGRRLSPLDVARHRSTTQNFRGIRNNLVERLPSTDNPVVAVLSSESGEGKTSLVLGLARALSYEGRAVLVVDGDLRRHGLTSVLALEDRPGWVGWAEKSGAPGDLVVRDALGSVDVVPVGRRPPSNRSGEDVDLGFKRLQLALDRLRRSYDIVLVDTPNLTSYADSALISRYADGAVLVIPFGQVGPREVTQAIDSVVKAGGEVLGTVMSFTARSSRG